jgi:nucleoid-associated protein YgaU
MATDKPKADFSNVSGGVKSTAPEAPKADFGNVKSGVTSTARMVAPAFEEYIVVKGDSLSKIAKKFYGNANRWREIHEANKDSVKNPDLIRVGQVIRIPTDTKPKS